VLSITFRDFIISYSLSRALVYLNMDVLRNASFEKYDLYESSSMISISPKATS
jgi:hypothetical protein